MVEETTVIEKPVEKKIEEQKIPGKIVSAGKSQPANFRANTDGFDKPIEEKKVEINNAKQPDVEKEVKKVESTTDPKPTPEAEKSAEIGAENKTPELTDDQLKEILKGKGIAFDDFESLKKKVEYVPETPLTEEQKIEAEKKMEKQLLDLHIKRGGTIEQFTYFKSLITADPKNLGIQKVISDLTKEGFSEDQAKLIATKMHFQISDEELESVEDEEEKEFLKKQREYGLKRQENRGLFDKKTAESYFNNLKKELQDTEAESLRKEQHTTKAVDAIKNFQRKQALQLGEYDGNPLAPVEYEVPDTVLNKVLDIVKDPVKLEQHLYTKEGDLNLEFLIPHLINSISREEAAKIAYLTGGTKEVEKFEAKFGNKPPVLGGNDKPDGQKGKLVTAGKPQPFRPTSVKNN